MKIWYDAGKERFPAFYYAMLLEGLNKKVLWFLCIK